METALCRHGFSGTVYCSPFTGEALGVDVDDESHGDMYGTFFCQYNDKMKEIRTDEAIAIQASIVAKTATVQAWEADPTAVYED